MNYYAILTITLSIVLQSCCNEMENGMEKKLSHVVVDEHYNPTQALLNILQATNIKHDGTLFNIFTETQKWWLRPSGQERWENQTVFTFNHNNVSQLFEDLALVHEIEPSNQHYNYVILLGATVESVRNRLAYLITLWNNGVRFDSIIILTGQRPLDPTIESPELLLHNNSTTFPCKPNWQFNGQLPRTETEMIKLVFDQADIPTELKNIPVYFIDTPMQLTENGALRRPNTLDTIKEWLKLYNPPTGSILAISNQPFVGYQDAVLRYYLPKSFVIETVGSDCLTNQNSTTMLDSLARWIYCEYQMYKKALMA